jgi:hypothetical protein
MLGLGITYTPQSSGTIIVVLTGGAWNDTGGDGFKITGQYGSGGPPANGATLTGAQFGAVSPAFGPLGANVIVPFTITGVIAGLNPGTTYWIDLALMPINGGTANVHKVSASVWETS